MSAVSLRSFKLRLADRHVRIVPRTGQDGCPFAGPGVDLRGEAADAMLLAARPLFEAIAAIEPGVVVRSVAVDLERPRLTATLDSQVPGADPRPRVVRIDEGPALRSLLEKAALLTPGLARAVDAALRARAEIAS